ncbi:MASE1 domain-containing protein [Nocardia sp. 2YAB30]|uniref:MASE1 domain-containing protein n=1 Tax=unclassified Nocardia TaxID=2637762 RepID=UPI003F963833
MGRSRRYAVAALWIIFTAGAYFVAAQIGLRLALVGNQVTPLWPPTGVGVACLLLLGLRIWPGIALGAFAVNILLGPTALAVLIIAAGNTLAPVAAYLLLERMGFRRNFDRVADVLALVFLGAMVGMLISATVGSLTRVVAGATPAHEFWGAWSVWWTGDAMGVLLVTPLILVAWSWRIPTRVSPLRVLEAVTLILGTFVVVLVATLQSAHLLFMIFPFLIWAALRFHLSGALPCALVGSVVVIFAASRNFSTFIGLDLTAKMITLQAFNGSVALTALLHATITAQRDRARAALDEACAQLAHAAIILNRGRPLEGLTDILNRVKSPIQ